MFLVKDLLNHPPMCYLNANYCSQNIVVVFSDIPWLPGQLFFSATRNPEIRESHGAWWRMNLLLIRFTTIFHTCKHSVKYILNLYTAKTSPSFCGFFCAHMKPIEISTWMVFFQFLSQRSVSPFIVSMKISQLFAHISHHHRNLPGWVRMPCFVPWAHWDCNIQLLGCEDTDRGMEDHRVKVWLEDDFFLFK